MLKFDGIDRQELIMLCSSLVATMDSLIENIEPPPDPACSCHMGHPPCNDCVEYSALREAISDGRRLIKEAQSYEAPDWHHQIVADGPIHHWFGLTYSSYLVLHRVLMTHMPLGWQQRMVDLLGEMGETFDEEKVPQDFFVRARGNGKFTTDPFKNYRHFPVNELPWKEKK